MESQCLIIMPTPDPTGYATGHVKRVYEYVVVPACRKAGYFPTQAENEFRDPMDGVKGIIDSTVVLCDVSAENHIASYALAIRHALNLPVVAIKDSKTFALFNAGEMGVLDYDESLRIDTVQQAIDIISGALQKAVGSKKERHDLLIRLGIGISKPASEPVTVQEEIPEHHEEHKSLPVISPLPDYVGETFTENQIMKLKPGDELFHLNHGKGTVRVVTKMGKDMVATIQFESGSKMLVLGASDKFKKVKGI